MVGHLWRTIRRELVRFRWQLAGLAAVTVALMCVLAIPRWLVQWDLGTQTDTLTAADRAKTINDIRSTLLQGIGGAVILLGAYFTYRQLQTGREQLEVARQQALASAEQAHKQLAITQQSEVTERFTRAVDQLGSSQVDVRIGGIYGLERIARDSAADRVAVIEVLGAFVRNHAPWPPKESPEKPFARLRTRMPDVQAAMTVLGRPYCRDPSVELQLNHTDLRSAFLHKADLQGAYLREIHLEKATLTDAVLRNTYLRDAHLQSAWLGGADLEEAEVPGANLCGADLKNANLRGVDLRGADLRGADLEKADLRGAKADQTTTWPSGFDPVAAGVVLHPPADGQQPAPALGADQGAEPQAPPAQSPPA
jgi:hypothetical protein